ncbi:MAG: HD domain-containing protein [Campylobacterota bacterium]|nr:HD domain-containing protein [Campylobacterota bacterium]
MKFSKKSINKEALNDDSWKVLVVDDEESVHVVTSIVLDSFTFDNQKVTILDAYSATEAKEILQNNSDIALVLLDVVMETNEAGLDLVKYIREDLNNRDIRIVIRTGQPGVAPEERVIQEYDINDYKDKTELTSTKLFSTIYTSIRSYKDIQNVKKLQAQHLKNYEQTLFSLVDLIEKRDDYTAGHTKRVAQYCVLIANEMKEFSQEQIGTLYRAAMLHDVGKIVIPDTILLNPSRLNKLEYKLIQEHLNIGYELLSNIDMYSELAEIIRCHHERYDGTGYPRGLKGDEIPRLSQIMMVADSFDAMTTNRIYKKKKTLEVAMDELQELSATQYHPDIVKHAKEALKEIGNLDEINQTPHSKIEEERFSYFFKDYLTGAYNENYLSVILSQEYETYNCLNSINLHNFSIYNKKNGWKGGDSFLKKIVILLKDSYPDSLIFRIQGDDFAVVSKEHVEIRDDFFQAIDFIQESDIEVAIEHYHLNGSNGESQKILEAITSYSVN